MPGSSDQSGKVRARRPAANWPAAPQDYQNIASYCRDVAGRQEARTAEPVTDPPSHLRDAAERANRLTEVFQELASAADDNEREVVAESASVVTPPPDASAPKKGGFSARRIGGWPACAAAGLVICLAAVLSVRLVGRSTRPPLLTVAGIVTDSLCGGRHSHGSGAACVSSCVNRGAKYAVYDGANLYALSDPRLGERFAARKVDISGTLDRATNTLQVASIRPAF